MQKKADFPMEMAKKKGGGTPTLSICKVPVHFHTIGTFPYDIILRIISR